MQVFSSWTHRRRRPPQQPRRRGAGFVVAVVAALGSLAFLATGPGLSWAGQPISDVKIIGTLADGFPTVLVPSGSFVIRGEPIVANGNIVTFRNKTYDLNTLTGRAAFLAVAPPGFLPAAIDWPLKSYQLLNKDGWCLAISGPGNPAALWRECADGKQVRWTTEGSREVVTNAAGACLRQVPDTNWVATDCTVQQLGSPYSQWTAGKYQTGELHVIQNKGTGDCLIVTADGHLETGECGNPQAIWWVRTLQ